MLFQASDVRECAEVLFIDSKTSLQKFLAAENIAIADSLPSVPSPRGDAQIPMET